MTRRRVMVSAMALTLGLWPGRSYTQTKTPSPPAPRLWLAPAGRPSASSTAFAAAVKALDEDKAAAALPVFARAVNDPIIGGYALLMMGRSQLALHDVKAARFSARQLAKVEPRDFLKEEAFILEADVAEADGDAAGEMAALQKAADLQPVAGAPLFLRLGRAAKEAGQPAVALAAFNKVIYGWALSPEAAEALKDRPSVSDAAAPADRASADRDIGRGTQLLAAKRFTDARAAFDDASAGAGGRQKDLIALKAAQCDIGLKKFRPALDDLDALIARQPDAPIALEAAYTRLAALRGLGRNPEFVAATRAFVEAHAGAAGDGDRFAEAALNDLATAYILDDEDQAAADTFAEMYRRFPTGANAERAAWRWGWWSYLSGNYAETARVFTDAFERFHRSDYRSAWSYWTARAEARLGKRDAAAEQYRTVVALYQNSYYGREAERNLAAMKATPLPAGRTVALARLAGVPPFEPGDPPPNARLITRLLEVGLFDEAIGELKRAEIDNGPSPVVTATQAYAWNRKGELRVGITLMRRAYPQFLAAGGEKLPVEMRRVIFPMAYWTQIQKYAAAHKLDPHLMAALITQESTFDPDIKSAANAWGLMQIVPATGKSYAAKLGIKPWRVSKLTNPDVNIRIGMAYFADMVRQYDGVIGALVAYNAGGTRYRRWTAEHPGMERDEFIDTIPFFETQNYLKRILGTAEDFRDLYPTPRKK